MSRKRSQRAKGKHLRQVNGQTVETALTSETFNNQPRKLTAYLPIVFLLILSGVAYSAWLTDIFVFDKDAAAARRTNVANSGKNLKTELPPELDLPQQNLTIDKGYNASSGKFPPGALPPGVNLPGVSSYNSTMPGRAMVPEYGADDDVRQKFTGQIRDTETNLDYFNARYYSSQHGRFTSVDPENASADPSDPQSWNAYAYARNNPLKYTDPDGREYVICEPGGKNCKTYTDEQVVKLKKDLGVGNFVGSFDSKSGLYSGNIVGSDGQIYGTVQQTSIDSQVRRMGVGAGPTLDIWQRPIEVLGIIVLGLFGGPVTAGSLPATAVVAKSAPIALQQFSKTTLKQAAEITMKQKGNHIFSNNLHPKPYLNQLARQAGGEKKLVGNVLEKLNVNCHLRVNLRNKFL